jgi:dihydrofolate synthase/folylpolyglutamate synthase
MTFLDSLAARRRWGMRPGLERMRAVLSALGDPQKKIAAVHVAGTNGKGAVCAILDACLRALALRVGRYTSPHLVRLNERFFIDGRPAEDDALEFSAERVRDVAPDDLTFFEALTAVAFDLFSTRPLDCAVLETGLGGRLDATALCRPRLCVITAVGRDHCEWLGDTIEEIAAEKAGIIKPGVPVVLGRNAEAVRALVARRARELSAPFFYAPDLTDPSEIPDTFSLAGEFNRENAVTAVSALKVFLAQDAGSLPALRGKRADPPRLPEALRGLSRVVWPGRFQRVGAFLVDGAHNPPAARALARALACACVAPRSLTMIAGFCHDKEVDEVLRLLAPFAARALAVPTNNPRALAPGELARRMQASGIPATPMPSLDAALAAVPVGDATASPQALVCGSLFLAGEALVALGASPWGGVVRFDPSERLIAEEPLETTRKVR